MRESVSTAGNRSLAIARFEARQKCLGKAASPSQVLKRPAALQPQFPEPGAKRTELRLNFVEQNSHIAVQATSLPTRQRASHVT
jgi:hypothetical protein